ncbi:MAG: hypothetical protein JST00_12780 [Deltaproteobacteria bacterium]|nr:hypothetical protein [Deltaproteobacteria bacterium]
MNRRRVIALVLVVAAAAALALFVARKGASTAKGGTESAPEAVVDRRTLEPFRLAPSTEKGDDVVGRRLAKLVVALDRSTRAGAPAQAMTDLGVAETELLGEETRAALGEPAVAALREVVVAAKTAAHARVKDEASVTALDVAVARLDNALLAAHLPYFVDASVIVTRDRSRRIVLLYGFATVGTSLYASGADRVRTVRLRRLDHLNWSHSVLGFVNLLRAQAVVLLDPIEEQLARYVLPALAPDAPMPFGGEEAKPSPSAIAIGARAGAVAREELGGLPGVQADVAREVGEALRARRGLYEEWNRGSDSELGLGVRPPKGLALDVPIAVFAERAAGLVPRADLATLAEIQARLERDDAARTHGALRDAFADSVERHEAQHRLDAMMHLRMSAAVRAVVHGEGANVATIRNGVNNELSAYLAQIARDPKMPRTTYSLLVRFVVNPRTRVSSEGIAGVLATEALARELGAADTTPLVVDRRLDEERLVRAHRVITEAKPELVASAARRAWATIFGRELPALEALAQEPERVDVRDGARDE